MAEDSWRVADRNEQPNGPVSDLFRSLLRFLFFAGHPPKPNYTW